MRISRSGLIYHIAFLLEEEKPSQIQFCKLAWRVAISPIAIPIKLVYTAWLYLFGLFIGCEPAGTEWVSVGRNVYEKQTVWLTYNWWPRLRFGKNKRDTVVLRPVYIVVMAIVAWCLYQVVVEILAILVYLLLFCVMVVVMAAVIGGAILLCKLGFKMIHQKGLCPVVEVE